MNRLDITVQGLNIFLILQMAKYEVSILAENIIFSQGFSVIWCKPEA